MMETVYHIVPAGFRPLYLLTPVLVLLAGGLGMLAATGYGSQRAAFILSDRGIDFRGDVYGRRIPWNALRLSEARIVDLNREATLRPRSRRIGTALPGYAAGWFGLNNGQRALVYLTERQRALYVPTTLGYALLLSPQDPNAMLAAMRRRANQPT
jgi:Bacterial PH domain